MIYSYSALMARASDTDKFSMLVRNADRKDVWLRGGRQQSLCLSTVHFLHLLGLLTVVGDLLASYGWHFVFVEMEMKMEIVWRRGFGSMER